MNGTFIIEPQHLRIENSSFFVTGYCVTNSGLKLAEAMKQNALGTFVRVSDISTQRMLVEMVQKKRTNISRKNKRLKMIKAKSIVK